MHEQHFDLLDLHYVIMLHRDALHFNVRHRDASAAQQSKALLEELQSAGHGGLPEVWSQGKNSGYAKLGDICVMFKDLQ